MNSWVQLPESERDLAVQEDDRGAHSNRPQSLLKMIPPERVGIHGEYDHSGLAKRVKLAFYEQFEAGNLDRLGITQRGRVVVLLGSVSHPEMLTQLVKIALKVSGTAAVETHGVFILAESAQRIEVEVYG